MANFDDFTDDEYIILSHIISVDALTNQIAKLTSFSAQEIKDDVAKFSGEYIGSMSDDDARELLKSHRGSVVAHRRARAIIENIINN